MAGTTIMLSAAGQTDLLDTANVAPQRYTMKSLCRTGARQKLRRKQSSLKLC